MKAYTLLLIAFLFSVPVLAQKNSMGKQDPDQKTQNVDVSCGKCKFGLPGKTCALAVRIGENAWYVKGASIDDFGDAHAHDGFCNAIRKAEVQGSLANDQFQVTYLKLLPEPAKQAAKN